MLLSVVNLNTLYKTVVLFFIILIAFSQADFVFPRLEILLFVMTFFCLIISKPYKKILRSPVFFLLICNLLFRIFSYIRSPFFGDFSALSIPLSFCSSIVVCFLLLPSVFNNIYDFLNYYKKCLVLVIIIMFLLNFIFPESYRAAGSDKGISFAFLHPNVLGVYLLMIILIILSEFIHRRTRNKIFNILIFFVASFLLYCTNSRGAQIIASIGLLSYLMYFLSRFRFFRFIFNNRFSVIFFLLLISYYIYRLYLELGRDYFDIVSSGRLSILDIAISDVGENIWLGLGILPRAFMYGFDSERLGAGLDGVYSVVFYNEGLIGLILLFLLHLCFVNVGLKCNDFKTKFLFFMFLISVLIHGIFEAHYWQRLSPSTFIIFGMVSLLLKNQKINIK